MLVFACISPHPPIILPNVDSSTDREKVKSTIKALLSLSPKLAAAKPDLIIISSPHPDWGIQVPLYFLLGNSLNKASFLPLKWKIDKYQVANEVTTKQWSIKTIYPVLTTLDSPRQHFDWGKNLIKELPENLRVCWIASGDMSHVLKSDGPYGFNPAGPKFDQEFITFLKKKDIQSILNFDPLFLEEAAECGLRSFSMLFGALEETKLDWEPEVLSYEGPFGVGYLVVNFKI